MSEQSVKNLKSRFEQLQTTQKPPVAAKPSTITRTGHPGADKQQSTPDRRPETDATTTGTPLKLVRQETNGSDVSDPFGSPLNSPALENPGTRPPLPGNKPRYNGASQDQISEHSRSQSNSIKPVSLKVPQPAVPSIITHEQGDTRTSSLKAPPPPPSPRLRSPKPPTRIREDTIRPVSRDIFRDQVQQDLDQQRSSSSEDVCSIKLLDACANDMVRPAKSPIFRPQSRNSLGSEPTVVRLRSSPPIITPRSRPTSPRKSTEEAMHFPTISGPVATGPIYSDDANAKPALPMRPPSLLLNSSQIVPIVEIASPTIDGQKPQLPRRTDTINSIPPSSINKSGLGNPPLPARTSTFESSLSNRNTSRQSLQHDRQAHERPSDSSFRRSLDDFHPRTSRTKDAEKETLEDSEGDEDNNVAPDNARSLDQPDASTANRKPPRFRGTHWDLSTGKEVRKTAVCGDLLMVAHNDKLKLHNLLTGDITWQLPVTDTRVTAMDFRTVTERQLEDAGRYLWVGFKDGSLHELDVRNRVIVERYFHAHNGAIVAILRNKQSMWTLDELGNLQIWSNGVAVSLKGRPAPRSMRTVLGVSAALVVQGLLWVASGRTIHIFDPSNVSSPRLTPERGIEPARSAGLVTCGVYLLHNPDVVYFGHDDGKISIYSRADRTCLEVISISHYNLSALLAVGDYLWASFKTGKIFVYDVHAKPWRVMKEWHAHKSPILELTVDRYGLWKEKRLQVTSMAGDGAIKVWDGLLMEDWLDAEMQRRLRDFSTSDTISALICTWNAGASLPQKLSRDYEDAQFIEKMIRQADSPDIIVFGFQELVDLDDKGKAGRSVAKGFFGKKKEKGPDEKTRSAAYQQWQNHLEKQVSIASSSSDSYTLLQVRDLVGLFTCLFVKHKLLKRIGNVSASSVKTGLKGRYGNKGGIVIRLTLDDTSMCFVNCHLAAGQKHIMARNNDIFSILDQAGLPAADEKQTKSNVFVCGGDGSMVLDHEICIFNGDLNYRINGNRNQVLQNIKEGKIQKLLENDQLLVELKKNATHRLRSFKESPIRFNPTYKYDPGTDNYDSSEKMRVPAWCDRIYYRGLGASEVEVEKYQAHVCRVSDHRPVSAVLNMQVKTVNQEERKQIYETASKQWVDLANKTIVARKIAVLREVTGKSDRECKEALRQAHGQAVSDAALALIR